ARFVIAVIVMTLNRMLGTWPRANVSQEPFKAAPLWADINSPPAVPVPLDMVGIRTSRHHRAPNVVLRSTGSSMRDCPSAANATTGLGKTLLHSTSSNNTERSAGTSEFPKKMPVRFSACGFKCSKLIELFARSKVNSHAAYAPIISGVIWLVRVPARAGLFHYSPPSHFRGIPNAQIVVNFNTTLRTCGVF